MRNKLDEQVILDAALKVFSRYGYKKSTLEDIAGELGMTNTAMYAYAASKRDLYERTVRYVMKRWQSGVEQAVSEKTTAMDRMTALCESALYYLARDTEFCALLRSDPSIFPMFPTVDPYEEINRDSVRMIERVLAYGRETGEFRAVDETAVAEVLFSIYKNFIIHTYVNSEEDYTSRYLPITMELILNGIKQS
ncbi:MAG: TetR/AcrR family transcriptional regulator [Clostridiales bacterium]|nr:TetR/AcrR family transcriptional regulator [Clostridiales bacterium]